MSEKRDSLLIIHGLFDCINSWKPVAEALSDSFDVHLIALRNHRFAEFSDTMSFDEMADDLKKFADENHIKKFHLLGHSLGGKTAMYFTRKYPQMVEKLIVVDITPFPQKSLQEYNPLVTGLLNQVITIKNLQLSKFRNLSEFIKEIKNFDKETQSAIVGNINYAGENFSWYININAVFNNFDELFDGFDVEDFIENKINVPTLFVRAGNSEFLPKSDYKAIEFIFSNCQFAEIDGCSHKIHLEKPDLLVEAVRKNY